MAAVDEKNAMGVLEEPGYRPDDYISDEKLGTLADQRDMDRIGKVQELRRNFRYLSIVGFTAGMMCTWEAVLVVSAYGLIDGGPGGYVWTFLGATIGFGLVIFSMAEISSIAPTAGGQYHWVSEFAPRRSQKFVSFMAGWICVMGWQVTVASASYIIATQIQGMIILADENYNFQRWHGTLLTIAVAVVVMIVNTLAARVLPTLEIAVLICHCVGFFIVLITLWACAPHKNPGSFIFGEIQDNGGWGNDGLACLIGMVGPVFTLIGPDAAVHMAEEVKDASKVIPIGMLTTLFLNGTMGFIMIITMNGVIQDLDAVLGTNTGFPFLEVFYQATGSKAGTICLSCILCFQFLCATCAVLAAASRQLWSFARDQGIPFSGWLSQVQPGRDIPLHSLVVTFTVVCLLSLINIGSAVAFNAVVSLAVAALMSSYIISTSCYCLRKIMWPETLPTPKWSMGVFTIPVNLGAIAFLFIAWGFSFVPIAKPVTAQSMNWSIVIYGAVIIAALVDYAIRGRKVYKGPVMLVKTVGLE